MSESHYHPNAPIQDGVQHGPYMDPDPLGQLNEHYIAVEDALQRRDINNRAARQLKNEQTPAVDDILHERMAQDEAAEPQMTPEYAQDHAINLKRLDQERSENGD